MAGQWTISGQEANLTSHKLHSLVKLTNTLKFSEAKFI